jgi:hypothetical protein
MVLLVFKSHELHRLLERYPGKSYYNVLDPELKGYWKFFGRVDLGTTWFFHAPVPLGTTKDNFNFREYLHSAVGAAFDLEFEHIGFWELRFAIADTYRKGRIFIAGDAAHSHPPYGGYGVNTGLEDARNLGWKLAAFLEGWGGEKLLDSYDEERRPVFTSTARDFIEKAIETDRQFLAEYDPERNKNAFEQIWKDRSSGAVSEVNAFEPNYEGSSVVWGAADASSSAIGNHSFTARPGHHLAPAQLSDGRDVYDDLGKGFALVALDADDAAVKAFVKAARALNVPLTLIEDRREGERARYAAALVLVRPDQFVAWASNDGEVDPEAILKRVAGLR